MKKQILVILLSVLISSLTLAVADQERLTLREAIGATLQNNPQFQIYQLRSQALDGLQRTAGLKPAMRISAEVENVFGTGDLNWFQGSEVTLMLSQVIELGDKRSARTGVVNQRQDLLLAQQKVFELDLLAQTSLNFIELAAIGQRRELLARATQLAQETLLSVSDRVSVGRTSQVERAQAEAALAMAQLAQQSAAFSEQAGKIKLASNWGELQPTFASVDANLLDIESQGSIQALLDRLAANPQIKVFASERRLQQAQLNEVLSRTRSDIDVGVGIRHLAELNDTALSFQLSIPLAHKNRYSGAVTTARAKLLEVESERTTALLKMRTQLYGLDQQRRSAVNEVNVLQSIVIPQLSLALDETRNAFASGRYSYLELTRAQQQLLESEFALIDAAARAHILRIEIERLSGDLSAEANSGNLNN